jgi:SAM-dependent methyltransferase/uncharacterized protein YbaR (Trm112 family)
MWKRFASRLRCPVSRSPLTLVVFEERRVALHDRYVRAAEAAGLEVDATFASFVELGTLLSDAGWMYPILDGLPVLLPYRTSLHAEFERKAAPHLARCKGYRFPPEPPPPGERSVFRSFTAEWRSYRYDDVIWDLTYDDNRRRLIAEIGRPVEWWRHQTWLEVGCGVGITTQQSQDLSQTDAVGIDLSLATLKATRQFGDNPFLHFAQASAFALPFAAKSFDLLYSRGVLHHTYSTRSAFSSMQAACRPGGLLYLWVYGPGSINANPVRVGLYVSERVLRSVLSRLPSALATLALTPMAAAYLAFNAFRRRQHSGVQTYTFGRALHAARDRFTPRFAHRQSAEEVMSWFREAGFHDVEVVDWRQVPAADQDDYRRNVGVRGTRS